MTSSGNGFGLELLYQTPSPALTSKCLVHPQQAEVEPAVVRVAIGTAEQLSSPTYPDSERNLGAITCESGRLIKTFEPVAQELDVVFGGMVAEL
jgi:hypothetical protein